MLTDPLANKEPAPGGLLCLLQQLVSLAVVIEKLEVITGPDFFQRVPDAAAVGYL